MLGVWRAAVALMLLATPCLAQAPYPNKQVRIVVPFPAGGSADVLCRIVGEKLSAAWSQPVIVDNRAGAGGNVGAEIAYRAEPDGYTLLCSPPPPAGDQPQSLQDAALRLDEVRADRGAGDRAQRHLRPFRPARRQPQGADRLRQGQSRQGDLCLAGQRLDLAPVGADARHHGRHRDRPRPLQGRGAGAGRSHRRPGRHLHRQHLRRAALREDQAGEVSGPGQPHAQPGGARRADHGRTRPARSHRHHVVRLRGACPARRTPSCRR